MIEHTIQDDSLIIVPVPALIALLYHAQDTKGAELTESEVLDIRDHAESIAMPLYAYQAITAERGYDDIDPENVWAEWLQHKAEQNLILKSNSGLQD